MPTLQARQDLFPSAADLDGHFGLPCWRFVFLLGIGSFLES